jgi:hypothetical protein
VIGHQGVVFALPNRIAAGMAAAAVATGPGVGCVLPKGPGGLQLIVHVTHGLRVVVVALL